jgi:hypothetical protein
MLQIVNMYIDTHSHLISSAFDNAELSSPSCNLSFLEELENNSEQNFSGEIIAFVLIGFFLNLTVQSMIKKLLLHSPKQRRKTAPRTSEDFPLNIVAPR